MWQPLFHFVEWALVFLEPHDMVAADKSKFQTVQVSTAFHSKFGNFYDIRIIIFLAVKQCFTHFRAAAFDSSILTVDSLLTLTKYEWIISLEWNDATAQVFFSLFGCVFHWPLFRSICQTRLLVVCRFRSQWELLIENTEDHSLRITILNGK